MDEVVAGGKQAAPRPHPAPPVRFFSVVGRVSSWPGRTGKVPDVVKMCKPRRWHMPGVGSACVLTGETFGVICRPRNALRTGTSALQREHLGS